MKRTFRTVVLCLLIWAGSGFSQYVEDSVDVGGRWVEWLAYNSQADVVYGVSGEGNFFAIACGSNRIVSSFPTFALTNIAYNSLLNRAYFCIYVANDCDSVIVIDGTTHQRIKAIPLLNTLEEGDATYVIWDSVSNRLYVSCSYWDEYQEDDTIAIIDCKTDSVIGLIPAGRCALRELYLNPNLRKMYAFSSEIDIVDLLQNRVVKVIEAEEASYGCYLSNVEKFYCGVGESIYVIDGVSDSLIRRISLLGYSTGLSGIRNTSFLLSAAWGAPPLIYVIDGVRDSVIRVFSVEAGVVAFIQSPVTKLIYGISSSLCFVFDSACTRMITRIRVGSLSGSGVASPVSQRIYLGSSSSRYVYVIRDVLGVEEIRCYEPIDVTLTTIVRNSVFWQNNKARVIDMTGHKVMDLLPGANDVRHLAPGVYFVRTDRSEEIQKVVVLR